MTGGVFIGPVPAPELHVMSFNIRRRMRRLILRSPDLWERRRILIKRILEAERPTILGVQEALPDQAKFVQRVLGRSYRRLGHGRNANQGGEGCPLFYDQERLALLDWEQTALSDTPSIAGSTTWGNPTPRVVVRASFKDLATGVEFRALNTHFDQYSRRSRMKSADEILRLVASSPLPALVTGDFNTDDDSLPHERLVGGGALVDCWQATHVRLSQAWGTFPDYRAPALERKRIDWILATPTISVLRSGINVTRFRGAWASDHVPVQAVVQVARPSS
ncbi:MAG: endonuclease/exonuclease/phosphatase family protein [Glaciihabitans sp.]|jgi:endonuclease/exonuclease/phosphatase family metal-dependent hydrolase|nr:endonuclease/exonuclease/phosphatase family protein [Glaciihabitans sp.]MCU1533812.1 endonuclease/exonuclease/phosphatase family protein [Glaciihabitans sp.]